METVKGACHSQRRYETTDQMFSLSELTVPPVILNEVDIDVAGNLAALVLLLFSTSFFPLLSLTFMIGSVDSQGLMFVFLLPTTSLHVSFQNAFQTFPRILQ